MLKSELLREAAEWERAHPAERYYEPNFPVIKADEVWYSINDWAEQEPPGEDWLARGAERVLRAEVAALRVDIRSLRGTRGYGEG